MFDATCSHLDAIFVVEAAHGRFLTPDEGQTVGSAPVMALSHGYWQRRFGGEVSAIGKTVKVNGQPFTIIGVAPESFPGTEPILTVAARQIDLGFRRDNVMMFSVDTELQSYDRLRGQRFYRQLLDRLKELPQVRSAALGTRKSLVDWVPKTEVFLPERGEAAKGDTVNVLANRISADYFETLNIPVLEGRAFTLRDDDGLCVVLTRSRYPSWCCDQAVVQYDDSAGEQRPPAMTRLPARENSRRGAIRVVSHSKGNQRTARHRPEEQQQSEQPVDGAARLHPPRRIAR
jgi:hypothetical protein